MQKSAERAAAQSRLRHTLQLLQCKREDLVLTGAEITNEWEGESTRIGKMVVAIGPRELDDAFKAATRLYFIHTYLAAKALHAVNTLT